MYSRVRSPVTSLEGVNVYHNGIAQRQQEKERERKEGNARRRIQSPRDELVNSVSHALMAVVSVPFSYSLVAQAISQGDSVAVTGTVVFAVSVFLLYLTSALYHGVPTRSATLKAKMRLLDNSAIYLLIAGTWLLAIAGVTYKIVGNLAYRSKVSGALYLCMGWIGIVGIKPLLDTVPLAGVFWVVGGGLCYSVGVIFIANDHRFLFCHLIWHMAVIGGTACHYMAISILIG
ncbi:Hly-III related protein [Kipferlia bialata]|uniref:Hly-III related protein n=1 Tax=Kipferlia bialata TaxID=797122 RepID=A0A9K3GG45_9EUKA|nr:Hly-III related protein [Kipferlia bialata]|eukprot:g2422.t1